MCALKRLSEAERRKEIMDSAAEIIRSKGFEKTTMEDIIAKTSLSKGGVYHYYGSVIDIFKDLMIVGIEYRNKIIKDHLEESKKLGNKRFAAKELVEKMIDDNPYVPLYAEFLIAKKRNPELEHLMSELQEKTMERLKTILPGMPDRFFEREAFQFLTDFINGMIIASNILNARETFKKNRHILEKMLMCLFEEGKEEIGESL